MLASFNKIACSISSALDFNSATLSGCIDIIVVQQPDGTFRSTPFHVRFGKLKVMKTKEKLVQISVNDRPVSFTMKLGDAGEGFFEQEVIKKSKKSSKDHKVINIQQVDQAEEDIYEPDYEDSSRKQLNDSPMKIPDSAANNDITAVPQEEGGKKRSFLKKIFKRSSKVEIPEQHGPMESNSSTQNQNLRKLLDIKEVAGISNARTRAGTNNVGEDGEEEENYDPFADIDGRNSPSKDNELDQMDDVQIEISLCGGLVTSLKPYEAQNLFNKHKVTFEQLESNPESYLSNPNLIVKLNGTKIHEQEEARSLLQGFIEMRNSGVQPKPGKSLHMSILKPQKVESPQKRSNSQEEHRKRRPSSAPKFVEGSKCEAKKESKLGRVKIQRTLRPTSDMLGSLNLKQGQNNITYTVKSSIQGFQTLTGHIYLWPSDAKIIVSDVDGTITKSDVLGQIMPFIGKDWSQPGIAPLYNTLRRHGYHMMYLTSRAIGQSKLTKEFIYAIHQDGKMLPQGPVVLSPDRSLPSLKREVVFKRPEVFKVATLRDIRKLFPEDYNPFHAGFGNRITDAIAYRSVGVPLEKIYTVNPKGSISQHHHDDLSSYAKIHSMVKELFPTIGSFIKEELMKRDVDEEQQIKIDVQRLIEVGNRKTYESINN